MKPHTCGVDRHSRILVASPLGEVVVPILTAAFPHAAVVVALDRDAVCREITGRVRFDVVIADLVWNNPQLEFTFDGLDVIDLLRDTKRPAPVIVATQGHRMEHDHLDEARFRPEVAYVFAKSSGADNLPALIRNASIGNRGNPTYATSGKDALYNLFRGRRGQTAGRMAGAIAAGRCTDAVTLAEAASVAVNTASKVAPQYLGPIIRQRGEHDPALPMTLSSVYRWCGLHASYLVSWCRRQGHGDAIGHH
jgi:hypothetical protein